MGTMCGSILSGIYAILAMLHAYWALGGRRGLDAVLPTKDGRRLFQPDPLAIWVVAATLIGGIGVTLGRMSLWGHALPAWMFRWGMRGMSVVLFARAVGDFQMAGFTKRVRDTRFAWWDTRLFSPLCLVMAALAAATDALTPRP